MPVGNKVIMTPTEKYIAIKQAELTRNINQAIKMLPKGQLRLWQ